jgi:hypothetical protein
VAAGVQIADLGYMPSCTACADIYSHHSRHIPLLCPTSVCPINGQHPIYLSLLNRGVLNVAGDMQHLERLAQLLGINEVVFGQGTGS